MLAVEATIKWGAVLVQRNQAETAHKFVERLKIDHSVRSGVDALYSTVWAALTVSATEAGQRSNSPITTLLWTNPVATAIAVELSLQGQWESAISWAELWTNSFVQNDLLSEISRQAVRLQAPSTMISALTEAASSTQSGQRRIQAVLAQLSDDHLQSAVVDLQAAEKTIVREMLTLGEVLRYRKPDLTAHYNHARVFMELARSAAAREETDAAAAAIVSLFNFLSSTLPSTTGVRQASNELDRSADTLRTRIRKYLVRSESSDISPDFRNYRRGLDRLAAEAESRRLFLIRCLCSIVEIDRGASLNLALEQNEPLAIELKLDRLCQLIAGEAILAGGNVPQLAKVTAAVIQRGLRTNAQAEDSLAPIWLTTVQAAQEGSDKTLLKAFESTLTLPGLRSCLRRRIAESQANKADVKILNAAAAVKNAPCRENSLWTAAVWLVRDGHMDEVEKWTANRRLSATDRTLTMSGIISSLELPAPPPD